MTDTDPREAVPSVGRYSACAIITGALRQGETRIIPCIMLGRYLIVQNLSPGILALCEVQVVGECKFCSFASENYDDDEDNEDDDDDDGGDSDDNAW